MENKTELIERLRKIANELEQECKPKFEVGKYHWTTVGSLYYIESINGDKCYGYGVDHSNNWKTGFVCYVENIRCVATESEVLEALTKEAVKRGLVEGVNFKPPVGIKHEARGRLCIWNTETTYGLYYDESQELILDNGIWATVIKELSFDNWYKSFINSPLGVTEYIKQTKAELIEILKNLPND